MKETLIFVLKLKFEKQGKTDYETKLTDFIRGHKDLSEDLITVTEYSDGVGIMFDLLRDVSRINEFPNYLMYLASHIFYIGAGAGMIDVYVFDGGTEERPMFSIPRKEYVQDDYEIKVGGLSYSTEYIYPCIFGFLIVGEMTGKSHVIKIDSSQSYIYRYLEVPNFRIKTPGGEILREKGRPIDEDLLQKYELVLDKVLRAPGFENVYLNVQRK